jgi:hypothetical protein
VVEASEHVLRFDWDDIAQRTRTIYSELSTSTPGSGSVPGNESTPRSESTPSEDGVGRAVR